MFDRPFSLPAWAELIMGAAIVLFLNSAWSIWKLRHIPTVGGPALPLFSYIGTFRYLQNRQGLLQEGYDQYKNHPGLFKIAAPDHWIVVVAHLNLIDELQKHSDENVSFMAAGAEIVGMRYITPRSLADDPWHIPPLKQHLTHSISSFFGDMVDELRVSIEESLETTNEVDGWISVAPLQTFFWVFTRVVNRLFVGLPIGRDPRFVQLMLDFTTSVSAARFWTGLVPPGLKPAVALFAAHRARKAAGEAEKMLAPVIAERVRNLDEYGDKWTERPNDLLQIVLEAALAGGHTLDEVAIRTIAMIFVGASTSAMSFVHVLYHLAADPRLHAALRAEADGALARDGWTKHALARMPRVDAVLRESQRFNGINAFSMMRATLRPVTLTSAGTPLALPAGTLCVAPQRALHGDGALHDEPHIFAPFRALDAPGGAKPEQLVRTSTRYVPFGHGKHACPGRFFAGNEMKAAVAHVVTTYDVKLPGGATARPPNEILGLTIAPNRSAKVMFRRRQPAA
ncbi:cytochrome P450 [Phanerochaete sordida]|uniref:Cytochrome P450 n=1 Tax=Phanerochaete sordida TaxID=48140 RepID=A0A9P3G5I6_9APHY|nr:cytochrome P450 [Phanerochaete sordida]